MVRMENGFLEYGESKFRLDYVCILRITFPINWQNATGDYWDQFKLMEELFKNSIDIMECAYSQLTDGRHKMDLLLDIWSTHKAVNFLPYGQQLQFLAYSVNPDANGIHSDYGLLPGQGNVRDWRQYQDGFRQLKVQPGVPGTLMRFRDWAELPNLTITTLSSGLRCIGNGSSCEIKYYLNHLAWARTFVEGKIGEHFRDPPTVLGTARHPWRHQLVTTRQMLPCSSGTTPNFWVVSYNCEHAEERFDETCCVIDDIVRLEHISGTGVHVICLQEVNVDLVPIMVDALSRLTNRKWTMRGRNKRSLKGGELTHDNHGNAILYDTALVPPGEVPYFSYLRLLRPEGDPNPEEVGLEGFAILVALPKATIICTHLPTFRYVKKMPKWKTDIEPSRAQQYQMEMACVFTSILRQVDELTIGGPVILAMDANMTPDDACMQWLVSPTQVGFPYPIINHKGEAVPKSHIHELQTVLTRRIKDSRDCNPQTADTFTFGYDPICVASQKPPITYTGERKVVDYVLYSPSPNSSLNIECTAFFKLPTSPPDGCILRPSDHVPLMVGFAISQTGAPENDLHDALVHLEQKDPNGVYQGIALPQYGNCEAAMMEYGQLTLTTHSPTNHAGVASDILSRLPN